MATLSDTDMVRATDRGADQPSRSWGEEASFDWAHSVDETPLPKVIVPKRKIIIEPVLMLFALFSFPVSLLSENFIYNQIRHQKAAQEGLNITNGGNNHSSQCYVNHSDPMHKLREETQAASSYFEVYLSVATRVPALLVTTFIGAYSDKAGRRYAIIPPLIGSILGTLGYVIVIHFHLDLRYLLVGSILNGFGGQYPTLLMGCFAYIADITTPDQRMFRVTVAEMAMLLSSILSPLAAAKMTHVLSPVYWFVIVIIGQTLTVLYAIFLVPETIRRDPDAKFLTLRSIKGALKLFKQDNGSDRQWQLCLLILTFLFICLPYFDTSLLTLFERNTPLCWDLMMIGYYRTVYIGVTSVGAIVAARLLKCCIADQSIGLIAGIVCVFKLIYIAFVQNTWMMFLCPIFGIFTMLYIPAIRTLMSKLGGEDEQGSIFGAIACAEIVCSLVGDSIFHSIYSETLTIMTGFVFLTMAMFYFAGGLIYAWYLIRLRQPRFLSHDDERRRLINASSPMSGEPNS